MTSNSRFKKKILIEEQLLLTQFHLNEIFQYF